MERLQLAVAFFELLQNHEAGKLRLLQEGEAKGTEQREHVVEHRSVHVLKSVGAAYGEKPD